MGIRFSLSNKLLAAGLGFLLLALLGIGASLWTTAQLHVGAEVLANAGKVRSFALRMELPDSGVQQNAATFRQDFDDLLVRLRQTTARLRRPPLSKATVPDPVSLAVAARRVTVILSDPNAQAAALAAGVAALVAELDRFFWVTQEQLEGWAVASHMLLLGLLALAFMAALAFGGIGYMLVLEPVNRLRRALEAVRSGDLGTRLDVQSNDEFGQLAAGFNLMARTLQDARRDLERKVLEKTASLAERNEHLAALYGVTALATEATGLDALTQGFMQQIRQVANADAIALRWSDEANERYTLLASDGLPQSLVEHEQCVPTGSCYCGQPYGQTQLRVIPLDSQTGPERPYCSTLGFRTVVNVPIELHHRLLGEVTLFHRSRFALPDGARELLSAMARHLASALENLRVTALEREAAVTAERKLLARELHDSIAQSLAFLKIQAALLRDAIVRADLRARDASLADLELGIQESLADVRELLVHFRIRTQDEDIEAALRSTLSKFEHQTGVATELVMRGHGVPLASDVQIQVLHIMQEALSNVRKHASAGRVTLHVQRHPHWRFEVRDDGVGFDPARLPADSVHVGLDIMHERAQRIDARLEVVSAPGAGTRLSLELPAAVRSAQRQPAVTMAET